MADDQTLLDAAIAETKTKVLFAAWFENLEVPKDHPDRVYVVVEQTAYAAELVAHHEVEESGPEGGQPATRVVTHAVERYLPETAIRRALAAAFELGKEAGESLPTSTYAPIEAECKEMMEAADAVLAKNEELVEANRGFVVALAEANAREAAASARAEALLAALRKVQICCQYTGSQTMLQVPPDVRAHVEAALERDARLLRGEGSPAAKERP